MPNTANTLTRLAAIEIIAREDSAKLSPEDRLDRLEIIGQEDWGDNPIWQILSAALQNEINNGKIKDPEHHRFDIVMVMRRIYYYQFTTSEVLLEYVQQSHPNITSVIGKLEPCFTCPCCGLQTLEERWAFDICPVCWWEDDGQDNVDAHLEAGGPNRVSLTQARINYLMHGIGEPKRTDLIKIQEQAKKHAVGRKFIIDEKAGTISELGTSWRAPLK